MCGITGFWNLDGRPVNREELIRFTNQLAHRGPDGWDIHIEESANLVWSPALATTDLKHRRPAHVLLDGRYWIVFNGEIYNFGIKKRTRKSRLSFQDRIRHRSCAGCIR
ncbi:MAG: hypothetical protein IPG80_22290 [Anaerolineales bacterium]|uniref:hypothetical protein n=1 Tax=Candidatus Villigracilis vicinus TaxID=3140679 RepID=UPI0031363DCB|nr:hypothetical protein [Anaerolineales bacterium]